MEGDRVEVVVVNVVVMARVEAKAIVGHRDSPNQRRAKSET